MSEYADLERAALAAVAERVLADPDSTPEAVAAAVKRLSKPARTSAEIRAALALLTPQQVHDWRGAFEVLARAMDADDADDDDDDKA